MGEEVDTREMKKALKEAGIEDLNLTPNELMDWYKVITDSKNCAEKDQSRRLLESQLSDSREEYSDEVIPESPPPLTKEKPFTPKTFKSHQRPETISDIENDELNVDKPQDATKITFGFNDMPKSKNMDHFKMITHNLKFVAVQNSADFLHADTKKRTKILYSYYTTISKTKIELAKTKLTYIATPKPIFGGEVYPELDAEQLEETYVSRSGRQTKRKNYCYDEDSLDSINRKKSKSNEEDSEWISKSTPGKFETKGKTPSKRTINNNSNNNNNNESSEIDQNFIEIDNAASLPNEEKTQKYQSLRKVSTAEVLKRSKLFAELPARPPKSSSRSESMFDILAEQNLKKKKEEEAMEKFSKTLEQFDEDHDIDNNLDEIISVDDEPIKRRVVPPIPGRKPINNRSKKVTTSNDVTNVTSRKTESSFSALEQSSSKCFVIEAPPPLDITIKKPNTDGSGSSQEFEVESPGRKKRYVKKLSNMNHDATKDQPSTSQNQLEESQNCPICNKLFPNSKIQDHAATCGDEPESLPLVPSSSKNSKISCSICDKVLPFGAEYEDHVQNCKKIYEGRV